MNKQLKTIANQKNLFQDTQEIFQFLTQDIDRQDRQLHLCMDHHREYSQACPSSNGNNGGNKGQRMLSINDRDAYETFSLSNAELALILDNVIHRGETFSEAYKKHLGLVSSKGLAASLYRLRLALRGFRYRISGTTIGIYYNSLKNLK